MQILKEKLPHIVIVGAGAGGLVLATRLGNLQQKKKTAAITLVNESLTHLWKPLWHEVAAGTLDSHEDELNLITHAYAHHFQFQLGRIDGLDRRHKKIMLAPVIDHKQNEMIPGRTINYDLLIIAVGSITNDFQVPGVSKYCIFLDTRRETEYFQQQFLKSFIAAKHADLPAETPLSIAIVGGGATGVELAAELHYAAKLAIKYQQQQSDDHHAINISIIESGPSLLANLPISVVEATTNELKKRGIQIFTNEKVISVDEQGFHTNDGLTIRGQLKVWTAGIKAPEFLANLDGLETNRLNQLIVKPTLQTTRDENIFAIGDCAFCPQPPNGKPVPPRAQAATQQAAFLAKSLINFLAHKPLSDYHYHDYGSVISLSMTKSIGNLMGKAGANFFISGTLARMTYRFLYRKHQAELHGWWQVILLIIADWLTRSVKPRLKLH